MFVDRAEVPLTSLYRSLCGIFWGLLHISRFIVKARIAGTTCLLRIVLHRVMRMCAGRLLNQSPGPLFGGHYRTPKLLIHNLTVMVSVGKLYHLMHITINPQKKRRILSVYFNSDLHGPYVSSYATAPFSTLSH